MSQKRAPPHEYFPDYVDDDLGFDYGYAHCKCGWESEAVGHPSSIEYQRTQHIQFGNCDWGLPEMVHVYEDGTEATI